MISFEPRSAFERFDAWTLAPQPVWPQADLFLNGDLRETRKLIRRAAPLAPGVYGMVDRDGELIYVGQSKALRNRLVSYFAGSAPDKAQCIIRHTHRLLWMSAPDELAALLRELELIRRWRPRFNVKGQPGRRRPAYLVLGRGPASHVYLAREPAQGDTMVFGPVRSSQSCHQAVRTLNDYFQLRDCARRVPIHFSDQQQMFPIADSVRCTRRDLGNCLAPCASGCSRAQYNDRVRAVKKFLRGTDRSALTRLEESMRTAAAGQRFEEAALFRDAWARLEDLQEQLDRYRIAQRHYHFVYPVASQQGGRLWYLVQRGQVHAALEEPRDPQAVQRCLALLERVFTSGRRSATQTMREDAEMTLLVATWFRSRPDELQRTLSPDAAKERLREIVSKTSWRSSRRWR